MFDFKGMLLILIACNLDLFIRFEHLLEDLKNIGLLTHR